MKYINIRYGIVSNLYGVIPPYGTFDVGVASSSTKPSHVYALVRLTEDKLPK